MKKIVSVLSVFLLTNIVLANGPILDVPPAPPTRDRAVGFGAEDEEPQNPVDMHTSALLVAGMGLIASYAYFAKRRKENI